MPAAPTLRTVLSALLLLPLLAGHGFAQGNPTANVGPGENAGGSAGQAVHQGANTTAGTTSGFSGPEEPSSTPPGQNKAPGPPTEDLCDAYRDTPAFADCLSKVLVQQ